VGKDVCLVVSVESICTEAHFGAGEAGTKYNFPSAQQYVPFSILSLWLIS